MSLAPRRRTTALIRRVRSARGTANVTLLAIDSTLRTRHIERRASQQGREVSIEGARPGTQRDARCWHHRKLDLCRAGRAKHPARNSRQQGPPMVQRSGQDTVRRLQAHETGPRARNPPPVANFYLVITKSYCIFMMLNL